MSKKTWTFFEIDIIPLPSKESFHIFYGRSKMIFPCSGEDSIYSSILTRSIVIMTPNCNYDTIGFSSALLRPQMALGDKIICFRMFSVLHFKETRL